MFDKSVYVNRRKQLIDKMSGGLVLILGNEEAPANYPSNTYKFRQDSSFLYFFGLNMPGFAGRGFRGRLSVRERRGHGRYYLDGTTTEREGFGCQRGCDLFRSFR